MRFLKSVLLEMCTKALKLWKKKKPKKPKNLWSNISQSEKQINKENLRGDKIEPIK